MRISLSTNNKLTKILVCWIGELLSFTNHSTWIWLVPMARTRVKFTSGTSEENEHKNMAHSVLFQGYNWGQGLVYLILCIEPILRHKQRVCYKVDPTSTNYKIMYQPWTSRLGLPGWSPSPTELEATHLYEPLCFKVTFSMMSLDKCNCDSWCDSTLYLHCWEKNEMMWGTIIK